jgi:hypothetical protein
MDSLFFIRGMLIENDIKGHISVSRSSQEVLPVVYEKKTEPQVYFTRK